MTLKLYFHPFSSFCQKVLIALYENDTPFEREIVDLGNPAAAAAFKTMWPIGKFPVLRDDSKDQTVPESSIIIEYLAEHYPGTCELVPKDRDLARETRLSDRFFDLYLHVPMQKVVTDRLRPEGKSDPHGVEQAMSLMRTALGLLDAKIAVEHVGNGRAPHDGRLRGRSPIILRQPGDAAGRELQANGRVSASPHGTAIFCPCYRGG